MHQGLRSLVLVQLSLMIYGICSIGSASNFQVPYKLVDEPCFAPPDVTISLYKSGSYLVNGQQVFVDKLGTTFREKAATAGRICFYYELPDEVGPLQIVVDVIASVRLPVSPYKDRDFKKLIVAIRKKR